MGFFAGRPRIVATEQADERRFEPEWFGPPSGVLPGYVPTRAVVFRTEQAILLVGRFDVYRTGVEFTIEVQVRDIDADDDELMDVPWERHGRRRRPKPDDPLPDQFMRFGIVFADGSSWSNLDARFPSFTEEPSAPFVMSRGGGGGEGRWAMNQWLWPLPPDGPLTFIAEWPKFGIGETSVSVDGGEIRAAAEAVEDLWTR